MALRRKIAFPTVGLWSLVGSAIVLLIVASVYIALLVRAGTGIPAVFSSRQPITAAELPSVFGIVTNLQNSDILLETKQPFPTIATDDLTRFSNLMGQVMTFGDIKIGAVVTATGKDLGGGRLAANAIVIIKNGEGASVEVVEDKTSNRQLTEEFVLARKDGSRSSVITPTSTSTWWVSPDGLILWNVEIKKTGSSTTTYDLSTRVIKE